jgi:squalene-hopene/tetraprenyl-beta-curcumene cyclase
MYIVSNQSPNGQWLDFALPTGPSDAWVTGYTGLSLTMLPQEFRTTEVEMAIQRAIPWCRAAMNPDYGWGYNSITGSDADSTANMISFLTSSGLTIPSECYLKLQSFQKDNGGFATYNRDNREDTWGDCHPDVTPVALNALLTGKTKTDGVLTKGRDFVVKKQDPKGSWQSYWWKTPLYSTWANLVLLEKTGWDYRKDNCRVFLLEQIIPSDPFELALYAGCLCLVSGDHDSSAVIESAFPALMEMQLSDGSWTAYPKLRLTDNHLREPWAHLDPGHLYRDSQRIFTTATALRVMAPWYCQRAGLKTRGRCLDRTGA